MTILVTGAAGFIGMHVASRLLAGGETVLGLDSLNTYYDPSLKRARLARLSQQPGFRFVQLELEDRAGLPALFEREAPRRVIHLAAQAGVRHSLMDPDAYVDANLQGFANLLEACRHHGVEHLVYASSSSVYGTNAQLPYDESQGVDHPLSLYAATKRANELMAHAYSHVFRLPATGVRLFTVYGPWYRPDMALYRFAKAILEGTPLELYNEGRMLRDFTYVDDATEALVRLIDKPATPEASFDPLRPDPATSDAPHRIFNLGGGNPLPLLEVVAALEAELGLRARRKLLPMQPGDVPATAASNARLAAWIGSWQATPLQDGLKHFVRWYLDWHERPC